MGANLTAVRAWTAGKRLERTAKLFSVTSELLAKAVPNLVNSVEVVDFLVMTEALKEAVAEETILVEETVTKASFDTLQATYDAYVIAHP